jgi:putative transcriptional regulator
MKRTLLEDVSVMLLRHSFTVKSLTRSCFDLVGRKGSSILLIKALEDANSISEEYAAAMKHLSGYIDAAPLIVAEKAGALLEEGVVYSRFGVYTLNPGTFAEGLNKSLPFLMAGRAGLTAAIVGERLRQKREERGYSAGVLSRKMGVSRRMIDRYESGQSDVSMSKARALYRLFGSGIFRKVDVFRERQREQDDVHSDVAKKYGTLGFEAADTTKVPFDVIARREKDIIFTEVGDVANPQLLPLQKLIEAKLLVVFSKKKPKGVPALTKKEFLEMESASEILKFLKEFE